MNILWLDSEAHVRFNQLQTMLKTKEHKITIVLKHQEALKELNIHIFDKILVEIMIYPLYGYIQSQEKKYDRKEIGLNFIKNLLSKKTGINIYKPSQILVFTKLINNSENKKLFQELKLLNIKSKTKIKTDIYTIKDLLVKNLF